MGWWDDPPVGHPNADMAARELKCGVDKCSRPCPPATSPLWGTKSRSTYGLGLVRPGDMSPLSNAVSWRR